LTTLKRPSVRAAVASGTMRILVMYFMNHLRVVDGMPVKLFFA
jgi:hypothetical protein